MGKNEKTSKPVATIASKVLSGDIKPANVTSAQLKSLAGSALTQRPDKKQGK